MRSWDGGQLTQVGNFFWGGDTRGKGARCVEWVGIWGGGAEKINLQISDFQSLASLTDNEHL